MYFDELDKETALYTFRLEHVLDLKLDRCPEIESRVRKRVRLVGEEATFENQDALFQCPITGTQMNGLIPFVAIRPSGHVVSRRAVLQHPSEVSTLIGTANWTGKDVIPLNPNVAETNALWKRLRDARGEEMFAKQIWDAQQEKLKREKEVRSVQKNMRAVDDEDEDEFDEDEDILKTSLATETQKRMNKYVTMKSREHANKPIKDEDSDDGNFLTQSAGVTNIDRNIAMGTPGGGRAGTKVTGGNLDYSRQERAFQIGKPMGGYIAPGPGNPG